MRESEIAVIGGGLLGAAFGWGLVMQGRPVTVFDEGDTAIRSARGNFGLVWVQGKGRGMPAYARWTLESSRLWTEFAAHLLEETGVDVRFERPGGYMICLDEAEMSANLETLDALRGEARDGHYEFEVLGPDTLKARLPPVGEVAGATWCPHDGHCNPLRLLRALHQGFVDRGGLYRPLCRIRHIEPLGRGGFRLSLADGKVACEADKVVICAGHGAKPLGAQVDLDVPVHPDQGQVLVTERAPHVLTAPTNCVRQTDEGAFMLGPSSRDVGLDLGTDPGTLKDIARRCVRAFPLLARLRVQRTWAALRVMTPDGFPVYQQSERYPGAFSFACHSGVTLAASHAMTAAQWVLEGRIPDTWRPFHPERFHVQTHQGAG